jgi:pyridoxal/pyridoxine/pyridoxamine kinase
MGDRPSGLYVGTDLVAFFREAALAAADLLVSNHFELEVLAGRALPTLADIAGATANGSVREVQQKTIWKAVMVCG